MREGGAWLGVCASHCGGRGQQACRPGCRVVGADSADGAAAARLGRCFLRTWDDARMALEALAALHAGTPVDRRRAGGERGRLADALEAFGQQQ